MNSAFRYDTSGQMPQISGILTCSMRFMNLSRMLQVEHRLRDHVLRTCFDLPIQPPQFLIQIDRAGIHTHADAEPGRFTDRIAREIQAVVQTRDDVREPDRIHIEHRRGMRIIAEFRRVAGDRKDVPQSQAPRHPADPTACRSHSGRGRRNAARFRSRPPAAEWLPAQAPTCVPMRAGRQGY